MPIRYIIKKIKGAFYAGSERIAQKRMSLRRYANVDALIEMIKALKLKTSSLIFSGLSRDEKNKIIEGTKTTVEKTKTKAKKKKK